MRERGAIPGAAGGVMITSSHNPAEWNGVKYKASYGGSGKPSIIAAIETYLDKPLAAVEEAAAIDEVNFNPPYIAAIDRFVDLEVIAASGYRFLIDCMYGAGRGVIAGIFTRAGIPFVEMRAEINPGISGDQSGADSAAYSRDPGAGGGREVRRRIYY